ncbi:JAB domain-containing protein [Acholeplasma hippikon]|nr:JAB domain-containing protein [Acholeplasma hippikon]
MDKKRLEEMMLSGGIKGLSQRELLTLLLEEENELKAIEILDYFEKIQKLRLLTLDDLNSGFNLTKKQKLKMLLTTELANRIYQREFDKRKSLFNSEDVYELIKNEMEYLDKETLSIIILDIKGKILKKEMIYMGTTTSIPVSVKEIFTTPIKLRAYGMILIHNHPTGDAKPSIADDKLTQKIMDASQILSVETIDHIIVGKDEFYSYKNKKLFKI